MSLTITEPKIDTKPSVTPEELAEEAKAQGKNGAQEQENKSWGDKFKVALFKVNKYFTLNYVINTALAVGIAYGFERNFSKPARDFAAKVGTAASKATGMEQEMMISGADFAIRAFFLTSGGTALLPAMKYLGEHEKEIEYAIGHQMDKMQESFGSGNAGSKYNLDLYERTDAVAKKRQNGEKAELSEEDAEELKKRHALVLDEKGKYVFTERKENIPDLVKTRLFSIGSAMALNYGLGMTKGNLKDPAIVAKYGEYGKGFGQFEKHATPFVEKNIMNKVPGLNSLADKKLAANILANDSILTIASSGTHFGMEAKAEENNCEPVTIEKTEKKKSTHLHVNVEETEKTEKKSNMASRFKTNPEELEKPHAKRVNRKPGERDITPSSSHLDAVTSRSGDQSMALV